MTSSSALQAGQTRTLGVYRVSFQGSATDLQFGVFGLRGFGFKDQGVKGLEIRGLTYRGFSSIWEFPKIGDPSTLK